MNEKIENEVRQASNDWIHHFNTSDADYCIAAYTHDAVIEAKPLGTFQGTKAIDEFWRPFMASGATNLVYSHVQIKGIDESTAHLSASWSMNVGRGIITLEEWKKQADGSWKLLHDHFEIQEQFQL